MAGNVRRAATARFTGAGRPCYLNAASVRRAFWPVMREAFKRL